MVHIQMSKLVIFILFYAALVNCQPLEQKSTNAQPTASDNSYRANPFAPNSAIFKIPVFKTINLDFRNANNSKIQSELLKTLKDLLQNKALKEEKIILNIKPPKGSNSSFAKNFTSLLKNETNYVVPEAMVGAQSTIFKKKNGELNTLRLTLYVIRQEKKISTLKPTKKVSDQSIHTKPLTQKTNINTNQTENITATVESVLKQLYVNSTENGTIHRINTFLNLISSTNFSLNQMKSLKRSIRQISLELYPNSSISIQTRLLYRRNNHVSKLEFEIDIKPHLQENTSKVPRVETSWHLTKNELKQIRKTKQPPIISLNLTIISSFYNGTNPAIKSIAINGTQSIENTTSVVEYLLGTIFKNMTGKDVNSTDINLSIISPRNFSTGLKRKIEQSMDKLMFKVFPAASISSLAISEYIPNLNISMLKLNISVTPKYETRRIQEGLRPKVNLTVISPNKETAKSVQDTLDTLKEDLQNLIPDSQLLIQARKVISEDLELLNKALLSHQEEPNKVKILLDLSKKGTSFDTEFDKILPQIQLIAKESLKPLTLVFSLSMPHDYKRASISSDVCSLVKTLTSKIPANKYFGDLDIEVTLLPKTNKEKNNSKIEGIKGATTKPIHITNMSMQNLLNLTEPGIDIEHKINTTIAKLVGHLPSNKNSSMNQFNISFIIPQNETELFIENILNILKKDIKILFPYSQLLIQADDTVAEDLHILSLSIGPLFNEVKRQEKNTEVIPIDLSRIGATGPKQMEELLAPLWSNIIENRTMNFDLKLRPVNDIDRRHLGNDICSIVDILTTYLPHEVSLNEITLQTTVFPDKTPTLPEEEYLESSEEQDIQTNLLNVTNPRENITNMLHIALEDIAKELQNDTGSRNQSNNFSLTIPLPENATSASVEEIIRMIKEDLLKLVPYTDILIEEQKTIKDELHTLELTITLKKQKPRKKFRIDLNTLGEFLPEEVDEVVYDIRKSENPFSFALEMMIPKDVDLESANSEICSVSNVVISNIPKESYLTGTILRLSISSKNKNIFDSVLKQQHENKNIEKNGASHHQPRNEIPLRYSSKIEDIFLAPSKSEKETPRSPRKLISNESEQINLIPTLESYRKTQKISPSFSNEKLKRILNKPSSKNIFTSPIAEQSYEEPTGHKVIKPSRGKSTLMFSTPELRDIGDLEKLIPSSKTIRKNIEITPNYDVDSLLEPLSGLYEGPTSRCVMEDWKPWENPSTISEDSISREEAISDKFEESTLKNYDVTDKENVLNIQKTWPLESENSNEEDISEGEKSNFLSTESSKLISSKIRDEINESTKKSRSSKGFQRIEEGILKGIGSLSSAIKSIMKGKQTENPVLAGGRSIKAPLMYEMKQGVTKSISAPNIDLETENIPSANTNQRETEEDTLPEKKIPMSIEEFESDIENIPSAKINSENTEKIEKFFGRSVPKSMNILPINSKTENIPLKESYPENSDKIKRFLQNKIPHSIIIPKFKTENVPSTNTDKMENLFEKSAPSSMNIAKVKSKPTKSSTKQHPKNTEEIQGFLGKNVPHPKIIPQIKSEFENLPLAKLFPTNNKEIGKSVPPSNLPPFKYTKSKRRKSIPSENDHLESSNKIRSFLQRKAPNSVKKPQMQSKNVNIPVVTSYTDDTDEKEPLAKSYREYTNIKEKPKIKWDFGSILPTISYPEKNSEIKSFLGKQVLHPSQEELKEYTESLTSSGPTRKLMVGFPNGEEGEVSRKNMNQSNLITEKSVSVEPTEEVTLTTEYPESFENTSESETPSISSAISQKRELTQNKSVKIGRKHNRRRGKKNNAQGILPSSKRNKEDELSFIPKSDAREIKTPIEAFNNDQDGILQYIENLNLSNSSTNMDETILNVATSVVKVIPRKEKETLELILNIIPPRNTTVDSLKNVINSVLSSLISSLPNDIVNIETEVTENGDNVIVQSKMKITISNNDGKGRQIEEEENLKTKLQKETRMIQNLSQILDALTRDVKQELNVQDNLENMPKNTTETEFKTSLSNVESFLKESLNLVASDILSTIENSSESNNLNFTFSLKAPRVVNQNFADHFRDLLKLILVNAMPLQDVTVEAKSLKNGTDTFISLLVKLEPQTIFTTSPIDLDDLNVLDMESVLTKIISQYISPSRISNLNNKKIIIDFIFETNHISSLNLENIESVIDDVFNSLELKGELMTADIKLGLTMKNEIIINLPYLISTEGTSTLQAVKQKETTPKPLEFISDWILTI